MRTFLTMLVGLTAVLAPLAPAQASGDDPGLPAPTRELTLDLRDAYLGLDQGVTQDPDLDLAFSARRGHTVLARPSDPPSGSSDFTWDPAAPQERACGAWVCVHYVTTTADAPPMTASDGVTPDWVRRNIEVAELSLAKMAELGYPAPPSDGGRGDSTQFDIYLADISRAGLYGYCTPEASVAGTRDHASSYCVLDDDFVGFPMPPDESLRVTAAHELFHAVQFGMDVREDKWFLESTATWMEEQVADDVNDNRQFLADGQFGTRRTPLDSGQAGLGSYGNWLFFQFLSQRYGVDAVRRIWRLADAGAGRRNDYSVEALRHFTRSRGEAFAKVYAAFNLANLQPRKAYDEGSAYRAARPDRTMRLGGRRQAWQDRAIGVPHLASHVVALRPGARLARRARLRIAVDARRTSGAVASTMVFLKSGKVARANVRLDRRGTGRRVVTFSPARVRKVVVVLTNASTRYDCGRRTPYACHGVPRDDDQRFRLTTTTINRR
ncbi:MXAN_6640 family putative metalloprotease [Nocardioides piscis]|uniref:Uncharacterized protein n=1 Tax=Nocardioides piscis TaxID=2714938 RepID=A0A6G7YG36_9ACTN|nr:MXAN_6640 family putative metalloprotease [Nocardioides piscis]QIK75864.1 hypothetical protein G7071_10835 [Nocardioides piscis]